MCLLQMLLQQPISTLFWTIPHITNDEVNSLGLNFTVYLDGAGRLYLENTSTIGGVAARALRGGLLKVAVCRASDPHLICAVIVTTTLA